MDLIGVIIFGGLGVYNFISGNNLAGTVLLVFAGLYLLKDVIAEMIEGRISRKKFQVIQIDIKPKWGELFKEYKLVSDDWNEDMVWDKIKDEKYHILKNGIRFTLLKSDLIYWNDLNVFRTEVNFRLRIEELNPSRSDFTGFSVKCGGDGFEIFLSTPESRKKNSSFHLGLNPDEMKIATIPYSELRMHKYKNVKKVIRDQILKKHEWIREEPDAEYGFIDSTCTLEHKYFAVYYNHV